MHYLRASLTYFALVFGAGFVLGAVRVLFLVPRLGVRAAELLEMPTMLAVIALAALFVVRRFALRAAGFESLSVGLGAFALLAAAELILARVLSGQSPAQYVAQRDPVSGGVYLASLVVFALLPWWLARRSLEPSGTAQPSEPQAEGGDRTE